MVLVYMPARKEMGKARKAMKQKKKKNREKKGSTLLEAAQGSRLRETKTLASL
jgi:hypothetical protein